MTNWLPNLETGSGPLYVRLADRIESDIDTGVLNDGVKLPPQRDLAYDLKVTIGTVGRAYALARERGLVSGEVGRGTYVLSREAQSTGGSAPKPAQQASARIEFAGTRAMMPQVGKIRMDSTAAPDIGQSTAMEQLLSQIVREYPQEVASYSRTHPQSWLEAGSQWLACGGWRPEPSTIVPTVGAHAGIVAILSAMTLPGDRIAFENLTYCSFARTTPLLGRRAIIADADAEGVLPEEFERLCAQQHPKILFLMPSMRNPTLGVLNRERREAIVDIARRYNIWLIEDEVYGSLMDAPLIPLAALAPERTFHVGSLSKSVSAGARGGWIACPQAYAQRILTAHKLTAGGIVFLLAELAARLVLSGTADNIRSSAKALFAEREAMARRAFAGLDFRSNSNIPFLWMKLPEPWLSATFKNAAYQEDVLIDDEDEFKPTRTDQVHHRIRIGFSAPGSNEEVAKGFEVIRRLLQDPTAGYDSYS